jgi:hypothetical protein
MTWRPPALSRTGLTRPNVGRGFYPRSLGGSDAKNKEDEPMAEGGHLRDDVEVTPKNRESTQVRMDTPALSLVEFLERCSMSSNAAPFAGAKCAAYRPRILLALSFVLFSSGAWSQTQLATIFGTISDPSGAVIPEVAVTIVNQSTGSKRECNSGCGRFSRRRSAHRDSRQRSGSLSWDHCRRCS